MKNRPLRLILLASLLLPLGACAGSGKGQISVSAVDTPMRAICDRHDAYVTADTHLAAVEKSTYLRTSALVRKVLDEAGNPAPAVPAH